MKKLRICSVLLIGLMLMGGTAFAFDPSNHVKVAPNGKGDLIFFPWYYTDTDGWQTKMTIINTSDTYSTVAKVVVRSYNWSEELVDFLIYLSPNDVWTGVLISKRDGTYIESTDDSCLYRYPTNNTAVAADFASTTDPARKFSNILFDSTCAGDATNLGYVEVIEAASTTATVGDLKKVDGKVAKEKIYNWYKTFENAPLTNDILPRNILTGYYEWSNSMGTGYAATSRGEIFADWINTEWLGLALNTGLTSPSNNSFGELEAAMAKRDVSLPYSNKTNGDVAVHVFNFPTKLSTMSRTEDDKLGCVYNRGFVQSAYFYGHEKCEVYTSSIYDLLENSPASSGSIVSGGDTTQPEMCYEVEMLLTNYVSTVFTEGWVRYNWDRTSSQTVFEPKNTAWIGAYYGTPVLPVTVLFNSASVTMAAGAHTDAAVFEGLLNTIIPLRAYYQYTNY